jgi:YVTN family beta-propeller protein
MTGVLSGTVTFLFTDIEGSTQLLKQLGSRYPDALHEHSTIIRSACAAHGGREVDTQGDAFFFAFPRGKDAVAAAVDAQRQLAEYPWPEGTTLKVRMGLHTGEPTVGGERYVGIGVHRAARIAAAGHGGQVLLSRTTRDLVEDELPPGVTIRDLGERRLKDLDRPERISQLVIQGLQSEFAPLKTLDVALGQARRRRFAAAGLAGLLLAAIAIGALLATRSGGSGAVPANSVALIDAKSHKVVGHLPVGVRPGAVAAGEDSVWIANMDDRTVTRVDAALRTVVRSIPLDATPTGIAEGEGAVWVAEGGVGAIARIDPQFNTVAKTILDVAGSVRVSGGTAGSVTVGDGAVWAAYGNSTVVRVDPHTNRVVATGFAGVSPSAIAFGEGAVWIANRTSNTVSRFSPSTNAKIDDVSVGQAPTGVAVGGGSVWVTDSGFRSVSRVDPQSGSSTTIPVGDKPLGITYADGAIWIANSGDGTVSRIDAASGTVTDTIHVGSSPVAIAVSRGLVWVTVAAP